MSCDTSVSLYTASCMGVLLVMLSVLGRRGLLSNSDPKENALMVLFAAMMSALWPGVAAFWAAYLVLSTVAKAFARLAP